MTTQTYKIGDTGSHPFTSVRGRGFGISRSGTKGRREAALAYGHDLAIGRGVVYSAQENLGTGTLKSVSLPDATGEFTVAPNGLALNDPANSALLAARQVNGEYKFAGFIVHGEDCFQCDCAPCDDMYPATPVGNSDPYFQELIGRKNSVVTYATHGEYVTVPAVEALSCGDNVSLVDASTAGDDVNLLGAVAAVGNGGIDLPARIVVSKDAVQVPTGGYEVELYLG